jgi:hypothetical protein
MRLSRRASWFLLIFCLWTWFIWVTLVKNIWADPRSWSRGRGELLSSRWRLNLSIHPHPAR